jgi:hypothetical protein
LRINKLKVLHKFIYINRIVLLLSFVFLFIGYGYPRNETGFGGFFNHPQAFGIYLVFFLLLELVKFRFKSGRLIYSYLTIISILICSYLTESRVSFGSIAFLLISYVFVFSPLQNKQKLTILSLSIFFSLIFFNQIQSVTSDIISKRGRAEVHGISALKDSRFKFVEGSFLNFLDKPLVGIGFQISNGKYGHFPMEVETSDMYEIPIKASIEKGVFWSALFEETGLLGGVGLFFYLYQMIKLNSNKIAIVSVVCIFFAGLGESFLFSIGGLGFFVWLIFYFLVAFKESDFKHE